MDNQNDDLWETFKEALISYLYFDIALCRRVKLFKI